MLCGCAWGPEARSRAKLSVARSSCLCVFVPFLISVNLGNLWFSLCLGAFVANFFENLQIFPLDFSTPFLAWK